VFGICLICERYGREHCQFECILLILAFNRGKFCDGTEDVYFGARGACLKVVDRKSITIKTRPEANVKFLKYRFSNSLWSGL
jgi:hypothetical protein